MDAAVSLHHHGALTAAAASIPPHHHHRALHLRHPHPASSISARLTVTAPPRRSSSSSSVSAAPAHQAPPARASTSTSSRAATGYAAALADASLRAGTLPGAARHARALLRRLKEPPRGQRLEEPDARVGALVRLLVGKGRAGMVADVMAEFAALCDHLLAPPPSTSSRSRSKRAHASAY